MDAAKIDGMVRKASPSNSQSVCEMTLAGRKNSDVITLSLANVTPGSKSAKDLNIIFGTPLSSPAFYDKVPLNSSIVNNFLDDLDYIWDNQGQNANFLQMLNERFRNNPIVIKQIEIIQAETSTANTAQAAQQMGRLVIPLNSATDSAEMGGKFIPQDTQFTGTYLLDQPITIGEFLGGKYKLVTGANILMNIYLGSKAVPTFEAIN
jgi:hypothetical protein